ncbi:MAG: hypothetical protein K0S46_95 [Moraxellaceae bacterium]|jgi:hypothetical protein|nr:hypothetical protein [Moraxellaceae bacterium]
MTYLWVLLLVFLLGLGVGKTLEIYATVVQRDREAELIYIGGLYQEAIRQYYLSSPAGSKRYPSGLQELLRDPRSLTIRRYLRRLQPDPITGGALKVIHAPEGGIWGVASTSTTQPMRRLNGAEAVLVVDAPGYQSWHFIYQAHASEGEVTAGADINQELLAP